MKRIVLLILVFTSLAGWTQAQPEPQLIKNPKETLQHFGRRIIPKGTKLAHPVVVGDFGSRKGNLVIVFHNDDYGDFTGWVLSPESTGYKKYILPKVRQVPAGRRAPHLAHR